MTIADRIRGQITKEAIPFSEYECVDHVVKAVGNATYVLLGEATHGTSEFYTMRSEISKRLILEKGFSFIAVEGDWPSCFALNCYVKGHSSQENVEEVLQAFNRWPTWMWANQETAELARWLREYNRELPEDQKVGFYGLDMYSLWESIDEIIQYLERANSPELPIAKEVFSCFEPFEREGQRYGVSASFFSTDCEEEVLQMLKQLKNRKTTNMEDPESALSLELNALVASNAEQYYRSMVRGGPESWNIRDTHMVEVAKRLIGFHGENAKAIIWEHNTHIGDARATDMVEEGMVNVGQLLREQSQEGAAYAIGFGTHHGEVIAARSWGDPIEVMPVPPARRNSWEDLLYQTGVGNQLIVFGPDSVLHEQMLGHRAIGVVYYPENERGNYVPTLLPKRYDAFIYIEETKALSPYVPEKVYV